MRPAAGAGPAATVFVWAGTVILAQEAAFRGYVLSQLARDFPPLFAVAVQAAMSAFWEGSNPLLMPFLFACGAGIACLAAGSIWPGVLLQAGWFYWWS